MANNTIKYRDSLKEYIKGVEVKLQLIKNKNIIEISKNSIEQINRMCRKIRKYKKSYNIIEKQKWIVRNQAEFKGSMNEIKCDIMRILNGGKEEYFETDKDSVYTKVVRVINEVYRKD